jgi:hypothetical protein
LLVPATNIATVGAAMFLSGVGAAGAAPLIFSAVAARGTTRYRGALLGFLAAIVTARVQLGSTLAAATSNLGPSLAVVALLAAVAAYLLYRYLPKLLPLTTVDTFVDFPKLTDLPGFWKTALGLIFAISQATNSTSSIYQSGPLYERDSTNFALQMTGLRIATVVGIIAWGLLVTGCQPIAYSSSPLCLPYQRPP